MNAQQEWWKVVREANEFWDAYEKRTTRPTLYRYTIACTGMFKSVYAYVRAHDREQAVNKARGQYPRLLNYNVIKEELA